MQNTDTLKSILLLAANPIGTKGLRLQEEEREIRERLRLAGHGKTPINSTGATRPRDIIQAMLDWNPQIVHFSGHGAEQQGLVFEDVAGHEKLVGSTALEELFSLFSESVECVVLNACYSKFQAEAIARQIKYVIGMNKEIGDKAAIEFSVGFYSALGAGRPIEFAYQIGCSAIQLGGFSEELTPVLYKDGKLKIRFYKDTRSENEQLEIAPEVVQSTLDIDIRKLSLVNQALGDSKKESLKMPEQLKNQDSEVQNLSVPNAETRDLIHRLFDVLSSPNSEISVQKFEEIAHQSLFKDGRIDPFFRKNCFNIAVERLNLYKQPPEIVSNESTGRVRLGLRGKKEDGREEKFVIARKDSLGGFEGSVRIFFPTHGGAPKISGINF